LCFTKANDHPGSNKSSGTERILLCLTNALGSGPILPRPSSGARALPLQHGSVVSEKANARNSGGVGLCAVISAWSNFRVHSDGSVPAE
jgi:hypothetical protein